MAFKCALDERERTRGRRAVPWSPAGAVAQPLPPSLPCSDCIFLRPGTQAISLESCIQQLSGGIAFILRCPLGVPGHLTLPAPLSPPFSHLSFNHTGSIAHLHPLDRLYRVSCMYIHSPNAIHEVFIPVYLLYSSLGGLLETLNMCLKTCLIPS